MVFEGLSFGENKNLIKNSRHKLESVTYLGVKIDTNLNWKYHVNDLSIKLNRFNALLFKMRKYVKIL